MDKLVGCIWMMTRQAFRPCHQLDPLAESIRALKALLSWKHQRECTARFYQCKIICAIVNILDEATSKRSVDDLLCLMSFSLENIERPVKRHLGDAIVRSLMGLLERTQSVVSDRTCNAAMRTVSLPSERIFRNSSSHEMIDTGSTLKHDNTKILNKSMSSITSEAHASWNAHPIPKHVGETITVTSGHGIRTKAITKHMIFRNIQRCLSDPVSYCVDSPFYKRTRLFTASTQEMYKGTSDSRKLAKPMGQAYCHREQSLKTAIAVIRTLELVARKTEDVVWIFNKMKTIESILKLMHVCASEYPIIKEIVVFLMIMEDLCTSVASKLRTERILSEVVGLLGHLCRYKKEVSMKHGYTKEIVHRNTIMKYIFSKTSRQFLLSDVYTVYEYTSSAPQKIWQLWVWV